MARSSTGQTEKRDRHVATPVNAPKQNSSKRVFLGWENAPLPTAVKWVVSNLANAGVLDLSKHLVVIPSARARRSFLRQLHRTCRTSNLRLIPPEVTTLGNFPEFLYEAEQPFADQATRLMCWLFGFQSLTLAERQMFLPRLTASDFGAELSFAEQLMELHSRLATEVRSFQSVCDHLKDFPDLGDSQRWRLLAKVQSAYYERLSQLEWWDLQAARSVAIHQHACNSDRDLLMIAASDLSESNRRMLQQVAGKLTCLIVAPEAHADGFDEFGCLRPDYWIGLRLQIPESMVRVADRPIDQAFAVLDQLRSLNGQFSADQITVGVPDDRVVPHIELALRNEGLITRRLEGELFELLPPARALSCLAGFLREESYANFAQLVRHPDIFAWLSSRIGRADWLGAVDEYQGHYYSHRVSLTKPTTLEVDAAHLQVVVDIQKMLADLIRPLIEAGKDLKDYVEGWLAVLSAIYGMETPGGKELHERSGARAQDYDAAAILRDALEAILDVSENQNPKGQRNTIPVGDAGDVLEWVMRLIPSRGNGDEACPDAIELVGWLDLPLDDAPVLIVTGVNEEAIRSQDPIIPLIPPVLAASLGISRSNQRQARDINALAIMSSWRSHVTFIAGRHDADGNPNLISRLLMSVDDETMVRRAKAFFTYAGEATRRRWLMREKPPASHQQLRIPRPKPVTAIRQMSATRFREYLKCPFRFYLGEVLKLESVRDDFRELDGGSFGDLAHNILEAFGKNPIRDSRDPQQIYAYFCQELDERLAREHAQDWFSAIKVQIESLRERLRCFAEIQAARRAEDWRIVAVEQSAAYTFEVNEQPFKVTGRIDRIDVGPTGQLAVWDYKTSDSGSSIEQAHRDAKGNWIDLQLPLYRYLIESILPEAAHQRDQIQLGYILLPRNIKDIRFDSAAWTADDYASADALSLKVIGQVQRQEFWPPAESPPKFAEQFAAICQDGIYETELDR